MTHGIEQGEFEARVAALAQSRFPGSVLGIEPIEGGLGARRFFRVRLEGDAPATVIARVEIAEDPALRPPGVAPEPPLEPLRSFLEEHGLPVPRSYGSDEDAGVLLLEDAGPASLLSLAPALSAAERRALYDEACSWLPPLQRLDATPDRVAAFGRRLDAALFAYKAEQVIEWLLPLALARPARPTEAEVVREAFKWVGEQCARAPARLAHRDYKAANLHLRPDAGAGRRLLMIDLQGAFLAPPEYDLVCLLRDSQVALGEEEVDAHLAAIRPQLPDAPEPQMFALRFALLTLTRNGKDLARFLYAARTRGDNRYLESLPRAIAILKRAAAFAQSADKRLAALGELIHRLPEGEALAERVTHVTGRQPPASDRRDEEGETPCAG